MRPQADGQSCQRRQPSAAHVLRTFSLHARRAASSPRTPGAYQVFGIFCEVKLQFLPHVVLNLRRRPSTRP